MVIDPTPTRRTVLKALGTTGTLGSISTTTALADQHIEELRLVSEVAVDHAHEVVTQDDYAYVAIGRGLGVTTRGTQIADLNASAPEEIGGDDEGSVGGVLDVKVDGSVAAMAHNSGTGITTVDVSDPENPQELAFYNLKDETGVHNCFLNEDHAYLTVNSAHVFEDDEGVGVRIFGDSGVEIVDISDPANPEHAATWRLRDEFESFANAGVNPHHDCFVQDDLAYCAFWDAGIVVLDVGDPSSPELVAQFGDAPNADEEIRPFRPEEETFGDYGAEVFPLERYYAGEGNAHYVQPTPDGTYTLVGDEKFPNRLEENPSTDQFGGIRIFNTSDLGDVERDGFIAPPEGDRLRTAHNFDVTQDRLHSSWYHGGVRLFDISDRADPDELARYRPEGVAFWTAVFDGEFTAGGVYGARSDDHDGGVVFLHEDRGEKRRPTFDGSSPPDVPGIGLEPDE